MIPVIPSDAGRGGIDWYHLCYDATGAVAAGPMKGAKKSVLCAEIVDCVHRSGCNAADTGNLPCYCGAGVTTDECASRRLRTPGSLQGSDRRWRGIETRR